MMIFRRRHTTTVTSDTADGAEVEAVGGEKAGSGYKEPIGINQPPTNREFGDLLRQAAGLLRDGHPAEALKSYEGFLRRFAPIPRDALGDIPPSDWEHGVVSALVQRSRLLSELGQYEEALKASQAALELTNRDLPQLPHIRLDALLQVGSAAARLGRFAEAVETLDELRLVYSDDFVSGVQRSVARAFATESYVLLGIASEPHTAERLSERRGSPGGSGSSV
jgi:tetratricopeptide (TPR) repeat protein